MTKTGVMKTLNHLINNSKCNTGQKQTVTLDYNIKIYFVKRDEMRYIYQIGPNIINNIWFCPD